MGPGTPAMTGIGHSTSQVIQDGRWIAVDSEQDQYLEDGTFVLKWQLHWVSGWDPEHGEYRAVMADNYGHADVYRGRVEGDRLVFESMRDTGPRLRFTWDASVPGVITWRNEMAAADRSWFPHRGILHDAATAVTIPAVAASPYRGHLTIRTGRSVR